MRFCGFVIAVALPLILMAKCRAEKPEIIVLNDDGGWCWYQDERALVHNGVLLVGSIADGRTDPARRGNLELTCWDLETQKIEHVVLRENFERDDHDVPALIRRNDGRVLAVYCKHNRSNRIYSRVTRSKDSFTDWLPEQVFVPSESSMVTYSNLVHLSRENSGAGRLYNFYRGYDDRFKPSWMVSDDGGETWSSKGLFIDSTKTRRLRPYVKYISDGEQTIHCIFTEGHPRDFDNSLYHAFYRGGAFYRTDGTLLHAVEDGPITPEEATRVFAGDPQNVAWCSDLHLDATGHPVAVYSVQKDAAGIPPGNPENGKDHRYRYARWDGSRWHDHEIAFAGTCLYSAESDYTGNICVDPNDANVVYFSSNVDVSDGSPNESGRYEIYRGVTKDLGKTWEIAAVTSGSSQDNLRPLVPRWDSDQTALLWLRGSLRTYSDYGLEVVGTLLDREPTASQTPKAPR